MAVRIDEFSELKIQVARELLVRVEGSGSLAARLPGWALGDRIAPETPLASAIRTCGLGSMKEDAILFLEILDHVLLLLVHPVGQGNHQ